MCQIDGEDFVNFCGLFRKHELQSIIRNLSLFFLIIINYIDTLQNKKRVATLTATYLRLIADVGNPKTPAPLASANIGNGDPPSPLRHADILNGWSLRVIEF